MSKRYRDKLDELEAKVGPEKFKELTGMTPPSQTKSGRAASGQAVNGLLPALQKAATALVAAVQAASSLSLGSPHMVPIVAAATTVLAVVVTYKLWHHRDRTGFRVPLVKGHASLSPPPRRHAVPHRHAAPRRLTCSGGLFAASLRRHVLTVSPPRCAADFIDAVQPAVPCSAAVQRRRAG